MKNDNIIRIGDPDGSGNNYSVEIGLNGYTDPLQFIVNDVFSEQEALDSVVDYCEENNWNGLFADDSEIAEEYPDDFITAGNHCHLLPRDQIIIHRLNESKKQSIKLNESQLRKIISESIKRTLIEMK